MRMEQMIGYMVFLVIAFAVAVVTIPAIFADDHMYYSEVIISENIFLPKCEKDDSCLTPSSSVLEVNGILNFTNTDIAVHHMMSGWPGEPTLDWSTGMIFPNDYELVKFEHKGEFPYFCPFHPWIIGHVKVIDTYGNEIIIPPEPDYDYRIRDVVKFPMDFTSQEDSQNFTYLLQVKDHNDVTIHLAYVHGIFKEGQSFENHPLYDMTFIPKSKGNYTAQQYLWSDMKNPISLDERKINSFIVG